MGLTYALMTSSLVGPMSPQSRNRLLPVTFAAMRVASPAADAQSYIELLHASILRRSHIRL